MPTKMLCIFDGLGLLPQGPNNAPGLAKMPNFRRVLSQYPWITLHADGESVGQEDGLVGNSEVGHMNIGGLKLVKQLSVQITESSLSGYSILSDDQLFNPHKFLAKKFTSGSKVLHLVGLFSTASVHSDLRHWLGAVQAGLEAGAGKVVLHIISDGRDSDRQSLVATWNKFYEMMSARNLDFDRIVLGSLGGRFYLMDRDKNYVRNWQGLCPLLDPSLWQTQFEDIQNYFDQVHTSHIENTKPSPRFDKTTIAQATEHLQIAASESYKKESYDETIEPMGLSQEDLIKPGETVWLVNFRTDRLRQTTIALVDLNECLGWKLAILATNDYGTTKEKYLTADLDTVDFEDLSGYYPVFKSQPVQNTLAERISQMHKTQLHIAETEKYNHVTFFLNGGQNITFEGEQHQLVPSNKVKSHAEMPLMKTKEIADYILENYAKFDYIIANFACPDMIGHTGDINAAIKTLEFLDQNFGRIMEVVERGELDIVLIADHGNIEIVGLVENGEDSYTDTAHNPNPVPCVFIKKGFDQAQFLASLEVNKLKYNLDLDIKKIQSNFIKHPQISLENTNGWLTADQIIKPKLPLWYSGAFLLAI